MIYWKTTIPKDRSGVTYYNEREVICTKALLVKYKIDDNVYFDKAVYIPSRKEWQDWETFELPNVIGWHDLTEDLIQNL